MLAGMGCGLWFADTQALLLLAPTPTSQNTGTLLPADVTNVVSPVPFQVKTLMVVAPPPLPKSAVTRMSPTLWVPVKLGAVASAIGFFRNQNPIAESPSLAARVAPKYSNLVPLTTYSLAKACTKSSLLGTEASPYRQYWVVTPAALISRSSLEPPWMNASSGPDSPPTWSRLNTGRLTSQSSPPP